MSVAQLPTVTASAHGWLRLRAMRPGIMPSATITPTSVAIRTRRTIQAKMSIMDMETSLGSFCGQRQLGRLERRRRPEAHALDDRHRLHHRDVELARALRRKIHHVAGHRRRRLRQEDRDPAVLERLEQVADLPAVLDADQYRREIVGLLELRHACSHAL